MRATMVLVGALAIAGCKRPTVFCGALSQKPGPGQGLNPLLESRTVCYDDRAACEHASTSCTGYRPGWVCTVPSPLRSSTDPFAQISECFESLATCTAAQEALATGADCRFVDEVSCSTTDHRLACYATPADCERAGEMLSATLHVDKTPCASRSD